MKKAAKKTKSKWRTVRCVVEYRTQSDMSERDFVRHVQYALDQSNEVTMSLPESKSRAKQFSAVIVARLRKI